MMYYENMEKLGKSISCYLNGGGKNATDFSNHQRKDIYPLTEKTITSATIFYLAQVIQKYVMR